MSVDEIGGSQSVLSYAYTSNKSSKGDAKDASKVDDVSNGGIRLMIMGMEMGMRRKSDTEKERESRTASMRG